MSWRIKIRTVLKFVFYAVASYYAGPFFIKNIFGLYQNFFSSSISFNLDTLYLNWNTTFPAVTVCEIYNGEKIWEISEEHFGSHHNLQIDDFVGEIVFFRGTCTMCERCGEQLACPQNFTQLLQVFRANCSQLILNCRYTNKQFNCCDEFRPIHTEYGTCYSFNSHQARKIAQLQYANNRDTGPGHLQFDAIADIQMHVHPPIEIPHIRAQGMIRETVLLGSLKEIVLNVMEVHNDASVDGLAPEDRRCRYSNERTSLGRRLQLYDFYSYSTCIVECVLQLQLRRCNCTNHLVFPEATTASEEARVRICDQRGLQCLTSHYHELQLLRKSCDCLSSCEEPEYNIVLNSADGFNVVAAEMTQVNVSLMELPTQRYIRRVTKNYLDFISLSVGGIAGLFFNASLLRVVEYLFMFLEYKWCCLKRKRRAVA